MNIQSLKTFAKENQLLAVLIGLAIIIFLSLAQNAIFAQPEVDEVPKISQVNLISAKDYTNVETSIKTVGTVDTLGTVDITAELSGEITDIPVKLGQKVYTGQPLIYINADDIAAQLKSAEAALEIERLSLDRLNNGITPESKQSLEQRLASAKEIYAQYQKQFDLLKNSVGNEDANSTVSIVNNLKTYLDNIKSTLALIGKLQGEYYADEGRVFATKEQAMRLLYGIEYGGGVGGGLISDLNQGFYKEVSTLKTTGVSDEVLLDYTNRLLEISQLTKRSIDAIPIDQRPSAADAASLSAQKSVIDGTVSGLTGLQLNLSNQGNNQESTLNALEFQVLNAKSQVVALENELKVQTADPRIEDSGTQEARIKSAEANLERLRIQYEKAFVVSPISGTIAALPVKRNQQIAPGQPLISVVDTQGLEVKTYINPKEQKLISVGTKAVVDQLVEGTVVGVSPSVDPQTGKIEVRIAINASQPNLTVGNIVKVELIPKYSQIEGIVYAIPLTAIKTSANGSFVYAVEQGKVKEVAVETKNIIGEFIEVTKGLTPDMQIVSVAKDVKPNQEIKLNL